MNVQEIIDRARRMTYTNSVQYTDTQAIEDFNIIYQDLCNDIINKVDEGYFWDEFTTNTVVGQNEYTLPTSLKKVEEVYIKNKDTDYFIKVQLLDSTQLNRDKDYYNETKSNSNPIGYIKDESIFIYPAPTVTITNGIKLKGIVMPSELTISSTEDEVLLDKEFHSIISDGMKQYMFIARGKLQEKNDAIAEYKMRKSDMVFALSDRQNSTTNGLLPNLNYYA